MSNILMGVLTLILGCCLLGWLSGRLIPNEKLSYLAALILGGAWGYLVSVVFFYS